MAYRFWKGRKFEIYARRFALPYLLGIGEFVGKEKIYEILHHRAFPKVTPKSKIKDHVIYGNQCEYRPVDDNGDS